MFSKKINSALILFLIVVLFWPVHGNCEKFKAATDKWTPFIIANQNELSGIGIDILKEVTRRAGDTVNIQMVPNKRALKMFDRNEVDMMVIDSPLWNDPAEAGTFIFSETFMDIQEYIYFLHDHHIEVKQPDDLRNKYVTTMLGYYYPIFEQVFKDGIVHREEVNSETALVKKLILKRTDAIFMDSIAFNYTLIKLGYKRDSFKRGMQLSNTKLGIKLRPEKAYVLKRFNSAIAAMKKDGTINKIIKKYIE